MRRYKSDNKLNIGYALSNYTRPTDAILILQGLANAVDEVASRYGTTQLTAEQCVKPLGLPTPTALASLYLQHVPVRRSMGTWVLGSRDFRRWVDQKCKELAVKPYKEVPQQFGPEALF